MPPAGGAGAGAGGGGAPGDNDGAASGGQQQPAQRAPSALFVFDFDHTVLDANSDTAIYRALPGGALPDAVKALYRPGQWTARASPLRARAARRYAPLCACAAAVARR